MAKRIEQEYIAVLIDVDVDKATPKLFGVSAMPTLVIADSAGIELAKSVGAPFSTPEDCITWFDEIGPKIKSFQELRTKWDASKHSDADAGAKFADAAAAVGNTKLAIETLESLIKLAGDNKEAAGKLHTRVARIHLDGWNIEDASSAAEAADKLLPAEGEARVDLDLVRAKLLLFSGDAEGARKLCVKYRETLLKAKDERVIELTEVYVGTFDEPDYKKNRELYLELGKVFSTHERIWEIKVYAAYFAIEAGDKETGRKELADVAANGKGQWKGIAQSILEDMDAGDSEDDDGEMD